VLGGIAALATAKPIIRCSSFAKDKGIAIWTVEGLVLPFPDVCGDELL
jgi:hypothetical protein